MRERRKKRGKGKRKSDFKGEDLKNKGKYLERRNIEINVLKGNLKKIEKWKILKKKEIDNGWE